MVERCGLRKQVADSDAFASAAHSQQNCVLRRLISARTGERGYADEVSLSPFVERFCLLKVASERRTEVEHVCQIPRLSVKFAMRVTTPGITGPALEKEFLSRSW